MNKIPVLMIVFNRPETTAQVFEAVRAYQPDRLYVSADGPRLNKPDDIIQTTAVRQIFRKIDWPCKLYTHFLSDNHGCRNAPPEGISWFFENEEQGVILEDDCLPSQDFFRFASEMLERYKDEPRVMVIGGSCFRDFPASAASYEFSRIQLTWGWATRREAWQNFDLDMRDFSDFKKQNKFKELFPGRSYMQWRLTRILQKCYEKSPYFYDVWDWMWYYAVVKNNGLCIHPNFNLVTNIGSENATHKMNLHMVHRPAEMLPEVLTHPSSISPNLKNDLELFRMIHAGDWKDKVRFFLHSITGRDFF